MRHQNLKRFKYRSRPFVPEEVLIIALIDGLERKIGRFAVLDFAEFVTF
jgi:hypothetical protein